MDYKLRCGIQPFWFWNGAMEENEIIRQVYEMADKGIRGFFIHPRQGLEIPYLSKEYFERVKTAVTAAKEKGLEVWLYDEYPYPSGVSGGEVILDHPEYLCKTLKKVVEDAKGGESIRLFAPWGTLLSAKAYRLKDGKCDFQEAIDLEEYVGTGYQQEVFQFSGLTHYNRKRYFTGDPGKLLMWTPPEGEWRIYLFVEAVMEHFKYFENFVDPLNPEAVQYYLQTTHERYKKYVGEEFGKTIKGVFSDEVTAFPPGQPWSKVLVNRIKENHGIDIIEYLPALWEDMGDITTKVRYAYWNEATEGFIESYDKPIYEWCEANQLMYVGEKPIMRSKELAYVHVPGIDAGHQKVGSKAKVIGANYRENGKIISSASHFYNKPAALCEAFHSIGWGMTLQDMKWTLDWLALQGVDWYVVHGFFYTADGLKKHDAPPSAFYQMPWWKDMKYLSDYAVYLGEFLQETKRTVKVLVIDPITSTWTQLRDMKNKLKSDFAHMQNRMLEEQMDYYIIDPQLFATGKVVVREDRAVFCINEDEYDVVVLPPMTNLEDVAVSKLVEYGKVGGKLCGVACLPYETIGQLDTASIVGELFGAEVDKIAENYRNKDVLSAITNGNISFAPDTEALITWLRQNVEMAWKVKVEDEMGYSELPSMQGVKADGKQVLFVMNLSARQRRLQIQKPNNQEFFLNLQPYESRVLEEDYIGEIPKETYTLTLEGEMKVKPQNMNALRIGMWQARFPDGQEVRVDSFPLIDQIEMSGVKMQVKQKPYFGCPKELQFVGMPVTYHNEFLYKISWQDKKSIYLIMEPGTLLGKWQINLNGKSFTEEDFKCIPLYANTNLGVDITAYLKEGLNKLEVTVDTEVSYGGIRNPLYLFGDFSVTREEEYWSLIPSIQTGSIKNMIACGLPFFAGTIVYEKDVTDMRCTGDTLCIQIQDSWLVDAIHLLVNGYETKVCAWTPYEFEVPKEFINEGKNTIQIVLDTTAIGLFEGQIFNQDKHCYDTVEGNY